MQLIGNVPFFSYIDTYTLDFNTDKSNQLCFIYLQQSSQKIGPFPIPFMSTEARLANV